MLTPREWEQLKTAIQCMDGIDLVNRGGIHVSQHNVLVLISRFADEESSCFVPDAPEDLKNERVNNQ